MFPQGRPMGRFVLTERLGAGGMGEVWKAWDGATSRWVAVKLIKNPDAELVQRFQREARLVAGLDHPGIAALYEAGEAEGVPYLAMQFVNGSSLAGRRPAVRECARIVRDAARAVDFAHGRGIVHRDLKPANLMIDETGRVFVMDFGLARVIASESSISASGTAIGTPAYMPPEQASGEIRSIDARSDVYSLGATLYELLTGRPPFEGRTAISILMAVVGEEPSPPRRVDPTVPPALEAVVMRCLEKDRARRYGTAEALAADLDRYLAGEAVSARPGRAGRWIGRHRVLVAATAVAMLLAVAGAVVIVRARRSAQSVEEDLPERARATARSCLLAMLDLRKAGRVDALREYADRTAAAVAEALARDPKRGEPHSLLGQVLRAQMRFDEALAAQERALALDPSLTAARYERAVLTARELRRRMEAALQRSVREAGRSTEAAIARSEIVVEPGPEERRLDARLREDLAALESERLEPERLACVRGLAAWARGDRAAARAELTKAASLTEGAEALARLEFEDYRIMESIDAWTAAIERDRGYHPFLVGRAEVQLERARLIAARGEKHDAIFESAIADATAALDLDGGLAVARIVRATARMEQVRLGLDAGRDVAALEAGATGDFEAVVAERPADVEAWTGLGMLRMWRAYHARAAGEPARGAGEGAVAALLKAVEAAPSDAYPRRVLSAARRDLGDLIDDEAMMERAIEDALESTKLDPSAGNGWHELAVARFVLGQRRWIRKRAARELLEEALQAVDESLKLMPKAPRFRRTRGIVLSLLAQDPREADPLSRIAEAIAALEGSLDLSKRDPLTWLTIARSRSLQADWLDARKQDGATPRARAIEEAGEALRRNPRYADALHERGQLQMRQARGATDGAEDDLYGRAIADFTSLVGVSGGRRGRLDRALAQFEWGQSRAARKLDATSCWRAAFEDYAELIRVAPGAEALIGRGRVQLEWSGTKTRKEALEAALADFTAAIERLPRHAPAYYFRALAWSQLSSLQRTEREPVSRALADLDEALQLDPGLISALRQRGAVRILMADHEPARRADHLKGAIADLDGALAARPTETGLYLLRGEARERSGQKATAADDYEQAIKLNPALDARYRPRIEALRK